MDQVIAALKAWPAADALLAGNPFRAFSHGNAPQNIQRPYVTFQTVSAQPVNNLSDTPDCDDSRIQVNCWATTQKDAKALSLAVRDALEAQTHVVFGPIDDFEPQTKMFRWFMDCEWWTAR